jgi:hypothetical protein
MSNFAAFVLFVVREKTYAMMFHHEGHEEHEEIGLCHIQTLQRLWPLWPLWPLWFEKRIEKMIHHEEHRELKVFER